MKKTVSVFICTLLMLGTLTGCANSVLGIFTGSKNGADNDKPSAVCYIIAPTANSQGLNFNSPIVQDTAFNIISKFGYISVVVADRSPEVVHTKSYDIDEQYKHASAEKLKADAMSNTTDLLMAMQNEIADDEEVDYLASLRLAVKSMASLEGYESKSIVVVGTGLSTAGTLQFQNNLLSADVETVVDLLEDQNEIPDFSKITIYWQHMGDVAAPQQALSQTQKIHLQEVWKSIIERGNGTFVSKEVMANPVNDTVDYPAVSTVELAAESPIAFDKTLCERDDLFAKPIKLSEKQVTFLPDEAEYLYPDKAAETIKPIAEYLIQHDEISILLAGTTAGDQDSEITLQLSKDRAAAVRDTLIQLGVEKTRISTIGLGSTNYWHVLGAGYTGSLASSNRSVILLDASSQTAKELE